MGTGATHLSLHSGAQQVRRSQQSPILQGRKSRCEEGGCVTCPGSPGTSWAGPEQSSDPKPRARPSANVLPTLAALQQGGRKKREKQSDRVPRGRSWKPGWGGCAQGCPVFSATLRVVSRHHGRCEGWEATGAFRGLRSWQLEQTKLHCTNSISSNLWAPERKNRARW